MIAFAISYSPIRFDVLIFCTRGYAITFMKYWEVKPLSLFLLFIQDNTTSMFETIINVGPVLWSLFMLLLLAFILLALASNYKDM